MKCAIWWIRRDLRLADNGALHAANQAADFVIPLFIFDPHLLNSSYVGQKRIDFLMAGLQSLDNDLQRLGSRLIVQQGYPADVFLSLLHTHSNIGEIYAEQDYSPYATKRDRSLLDNVEIPFHLVSSHTIRTPDQVLKGDGSPYTVYTPYRRIWQSKPAITHNDLLPMPSQLKTPDGVISDSLPGINETSEYFRAGENTAKDKFFDFSSLNQLDVPIFDYTNQRDRPDINGTSQLSPYLRFGMISARQAAAAAFNAMENAPTPTDRDNAETWLSELIWRDFYISILHHFPHVRGHNFRRKYDGIVWSENQAEFDAWCNGQTGYPYIDAAMRQLLYSGWMHNRARMAVASFLVKDLLIDWRWGEKWFMQHLIDGDPAANNGGWQWAAGTGTDAAPYFRIFNPITQGKKHDPEGNYVRQWVPELASLPKKYIHEPWKMSLIEQKKSRCTIGKDYPMPMVDHKWARQRTLEAYKVSLST